MLASRDLGLQQTCALIHSELSPKAVYVRSGLPSVHQSLYEYAAKWLGLTQPQRDCIIHASEILTLNAICGAAYNYGI